MEGEEESRRQWRKEGAEVGSMCRMTEGWGPNVDVVSNRVRVRQSNLTLPTIFSLFKNIFNFFSFIINCIDIIINLFNHIKKIITLKLGLYLLYIISWCCNHTPCVILCRNYYILNYSPFCMCDRHVYYCRHYRIYTCLYQENVTCKSGVTWK